MACFMIVSLALILFAPCVCVANTSLNFTTVNSPPLCDSTLSTGGAYTEITRVAFERAGYTIVVNFMSWKRAIETTKRGDYDGLMLASYKEDRVEHLHYTDPVINEEGVLFSKKGGVSTYTSFEDLAPYTVGAMRGTLLSDMLIAKNIKVEDVSNHELNIKKMMAGRVDFIVGQKLILLSVINTKFPELKDSIQIVTPPLHVGGLHNVISRKNPNHETIVTDFNKGLQAIQADGTFAKILQEHGLGDGK